ncbi:MAG: superoxide dismutase [Candidatus Magasanikbacteria bacterium RIFCSPHIGHO2_02_FULL_41_13]|uniref:superoxide dismutase n=1 Tax=Candidatus Magasanikbacteria bacterium RIFCSPHIGHO2_02_FULL_41_13 TaxID=1798676 RepID=A0A1F6M3X0_9BACT|nr:MAG: superoxide dismutase [Candidatus Magasanikbacteria bacterium RIFCSPHIGHO2_02_FULL_41_13]
MMYQAKEFNHLLGLPGFSDTLLTNHFTLYQGYVKNTNGLLEMLDTKEPGTVEYSELQRRFGWEWNGMRLHELYFGNMTKETIEMKEGAFKQKIDKIYGNVENWKKNFVGVGTMRGIGWVVLAYDKEADELFNAWINEHDVGHLAGAVPLLVMDVFEHAFMIDYGLKRADYITAFWNAIDWAVVESRLL